MHVKMHVRKGEGSAGFLLDVLFEISVQPVDLLFLEFFVEGGIDAQRDADVLVPHLIAGGHDVHTGKVHQGAEGMAQLMGREGIDDHRQTARAVLVLVVVVAVLDIQVAHVAFPQTLPALLCHPLAFLVVQHIQTAVLLGAKVVYKDFRDTQLNGIITKDKAGKGLPAAIANQALVVARLANENTQNKKMMGEIERLSRMIPKDGGSSTDRVSIEWENSGLNDMIESWLDDVNDSREVALAQVNKNIERAQKRLDALQESADKTGKDYSADEADLKAYLAHLKMQRMAYEDGGMAMMTAEQLRGLREILEQTVYIIRNENKLLGEEEQADIDDFAQGMQDELRKAKGLNFEDGILGTLSQKTAGYRLNTMGIQRTFERMGGYKHGGFMEKAGEMLNQGQYKRTKLIVEGTKFFDNVTGTGNLKKMDRFTHELVDIGLRTEDKRVWKVTREQVVALYIQAQNMQGLHHMTHGGLKIMNMEYAVKGDRERALHDTQTIRIGDLQFDEGGHMGKR